MLTALRRLLAFFRRDRLDDDVAEEIRLHLELRTQALVDKGATPEEADREARRQFGNVTVIRERTREQWGGASIDMLAQDVRYGWRLIRKTPGFSAVAIISLAVGLGASTVLFSLANSFLFRPLNAARPDDIVQIFTSDGRGKRHGDSSYADYETFRGVPIFDGLLASLRARATLGDDERPVVIDGLLVSGNYFEVFGLRPSRGRFFRDEEVRSPGTHPVVVLSHDTWRRRFDADPAIAGRVIELNGRPFTVVGVGPPRFSGTNFEDAAAEFFVPAMMQRVIVPDGDVLQRRSARGFTIHGRLRHGVSRREAEAALQVTAAQLLQEDPTAWTDRHGRGRVISILPELEGRFAGNEPGSVLVVFAGAMAGVFGLLAIASVNVATVLLARASARRKEIAVRLAVGASRRRLVRQLLTECALLAAAGGALGLLFAQLAASLFVRIRPDIMPPVDLTLDYRIVLFCLGASLLTVVLFGLAPALQSTRPDVNAELKDTARAARLRGFRFGLRDGLVVVQVGVSLALLTGAALMLRSAYAGQTRDPGFRRANVLSVGIDLSTWPERSPARRTFYEEAVRVAGALPGVDRVALAAMVPMSGTSTHTTIRTAEGATPVETFLDINMVGPGYFALLDIPVRQGREFTTADRATSAPVAVVNEMLARQFWDGNPVGKTFVEAGSNELFTIVGVIPDLRHRSFPEEPRPMVYFSATQRIRQRMTLHLRTQAPSQVMVPAVQKALRDIDRAAGFTPVQTMDEYFHQITTPQRLTAAAAMATGALEVSLVVMALYGVIAFAASQRRREIGLRMALGASSRSVLTLIMRDGLLLTAAGVVLGAAVAALGGQALRSELNGIAPADPVSFGGAVLIILLVGAAASYVPARRALRVDPSTALRSE